MKVWEKVIERRLREESEITQNQFGFMSGRGTMDAIFALCQLCEKYRRAHKNLHMVFIDLDKSYDRVLREVLWWALKEKGLPEKYVELVKLCTGDPVPTSDRLPATPTSSVWL
ncbi:uncharacterized protein LOC135193637 [Vanessa tameamea]|uniref:Uncharacterized protein LOC135193637 n=1 Tax=Vanessa tameamea TaxID=334116 RepID=A0ABM4AP64_VANTA